MSSLSLSLAVLLAGLLLVAAISDLRSRTIPNALNATIALLALPYWWSLGLPLWPAIALQIALALAIFLLFALVFALGGMGGGDVKMAAALALWLSPPAALKMLVVMSLAGGVLTLLMLIHHRWVKSTQQLEIPYGVAIAFAGFWILGERFLNHFS